MKLNYIKFLLLAAILLHLIKAKKPEINCPCCTDSSLTGLFYSCPKFPSDNDNPFDYCRCMDIPFLKNGVSKCLCNDPTADSCDATQGSCYDHTQCTSCSGSRYKDPLPAECITEIGKCNWYANCLSKLYPSCNDEDEYALSYGLKYCQEFESNKNLELFRIKFFSLFETSVNVFSPEAELWIDNVKSCLQWELVPKLSPQSRLSCKGIKEFALDSHSDCYTNAERGPSFCELGCKDLVAVLATVREAFGQETKSSIWQSIKVGIKCVFEGEGCVGLVSEIIDRRKMVKRVYKFGRFLLKKLRIIKRSVECDDQCIGEAIINQYMEKVTVAANNSIDHYVFTNESGQDLEATVYLGDFLTAGLTSNNESSNHLEEAAEDLTSAMVNEETTIDGQVFRIKEVAKCIDLKCESPIIKTFSVPPTTTTSTAALKTTASDTSSATGNSQLFSGFICGIVFLFCIAMYYN